MYQQQSPHSEHSGLAVVLGWAGGVPFSIWAWPHVDPFIIKFLAASRHTIGPNIASFLYFIAPIALFLLALWTIMVFVDEVLLRGLKQIMSEWSFGRWIRLLFGDGKEKSGWTWIGWVFVALVILNGLSGKT